MLSFQCLIVFWHRGIKCCSNLLAGQASVPLCCATGAAVREPCSWSALEKLGKSAPGPLNAYDYTGPCQVRRAGSWLFIWTWSWNVHPTRKEGCVARCPSLLRHAAVTLTVKGCFSVKRVLPYKLMVREVRHKQAWCGYITWFCFKALGVKWWEYTSTVWTCICLASGVVVVYLCGLDKPSARQLHVQCC